MNQLAKPLRVSEAPPPSLLAPASPEGASRLPSPRELLERFALSSRAQTEVERTRLAIARRIKTGRGAPLAIVGPCSIHCERAALDYADRLSRLRRQLGGRVEVVMRVYFEKPRTTVGWKGFLYDPDLNGRNDLALGLVRARKLLAQISEMGLPVATELLDPLLAPYVQDCLSWVAVGARTTESQIHRQMASGLGCPVGFKNGTDGGVGIALDAMETAALPHTHLGVCDDGRAAIKQTSGNEAVHLVLRGGTSGPNCDEASVARVHELAERRGMRRPVLVDCSHGNSQKDHRRQAEVAGAVMAQLRRSPSSVLGLMLESHLEAGRQSLGGSLRYGVSVTDACIDFRQTELLLGELSMASCPDS